MMLRAVVLAAAMASSGCLVLSLQPAYDSSSVVYDEALIGTWVNTEDETSATIERGEPLDAPACFLVERAEVALRLLRHRAAMIARDVRDDDLVGR